MEDHILQFGDSMLGFNGMTRVIKPIYFLLRKIPSYNIPNILAHQEKLHELQRIA